MIKELMSQLNIFEEIIRTTSEHELYEEKENLGIYDTFMIINDKKLYEFYLSNNLNDKINEEWTTDHLEQLLEFSNDILKKLPHFKKMYEAFEYEFDETGEIVIVSKVPGFMNFILQRLSEANSDDLFEKRRLELNSVLVNICIVFESFVSKMVKDILLNTDSSELGKKQLTYEEILKIDDMDSAKSYIIDKHLDDLFRSSFNEWSEKIITQFGARKTFSDKKELLYAVHELYQRRNLIVHTDGIVNRYYIQNVTDTTFDEGSLITIEPDYLFQKVDQIKELSWYLYESFLVRTKKDLDESFSELNSILLKHINKECKAIPSLFTKYSSAKSLGNSGQLVAKINYFLYYKLNNKFDKVKKELVEFDVAYLNSDFQIAKTLLLDQENCVLEFQKYIDSLDEDRFFEVIDLPIYRATKYEKQIIDIMNNRLRIVMEGDSNENEPREEINS